MDQEKSSLIDQTIPIEDNIDKTISLEELKTLLNISRDNSIRAFKNISTIGIGGIGAVFAAQDPVLNRDVALKILRPHYRFKRKFIESFIREARVTAQIDHPNIVPVHQLGIFDDSGVYFTMKKVVGENLSSVIKRLNSSDPKYQQRYSRLRLLEIFIGICNGIAFAHSKGVIHRDLKPANIMLGDYGEVMVMDWGLVKHCSADIESESINPTTTDPWESTEQTCSGQISGTPAFMAPEQIRGESENIDQQTDIYGLGSILYSILTLQTSPFEDGLTIDEILSDGVSSNFIPPRRRSPKLKIQPELEAICLKAMAQNKCDRYKDVKALIEDVRNFMDNFPVSAYKPSFMYRLGKLCQRHPLIPITILIAFFTSMALLIAINMESKIRNDSFKQIALNNVSDGNLFYSRALGLWKKISELDNEPNSAVNIEKRSLLTTQLKNAQVDLGNSFDTALDLLSTIRNFGNDRNEIIKIIADIYSKRISYFMEIGDIVSVEKEFDRLQQRHNHAFNAVLRGNEPLREIHNLLIQKSGKVTLNTIPNDATVYYRQIGDFASEEENELRTMGRTPFTTVLPQGAYSATIMPPNRSAVRLPLVIGSGEKYNLNITLPLKIPADCIYIPGGKTFFANNNENKNLPIGIDIPGYFIRRNEVTIGEYMEFWQTLRPEIQNLYTAQYHDQESNLTYNIWDENGNLEEGFSLEMPISGISGAAAEKYCAWVSSERNVVCRLPSVPEWEKAAGFADGYTYVWGDEFENNNCFTAENETAPAFFKHAAPISQFKKDQSIYDVLNLSGNVREFTRKTDNGSIYTVKGGSFLTNRWFARSGSNSYSSGAENDIGFRYVIEFDPQESVQSAAAIEADMNK